MKTVKTDICVIGAGSAGLSFAAGAVQLGKKVVLIEKGKMGGDCLNYGCVPSKALLAAGAAAQNARDAEKYGVMATPQVDFAAAMAHVKSVIAGIEPHDSQERFEGLGVHVIRAAARFTGPRKVEAGDTTVTAKFFIIATGSSAVIPPLKGLDTVDYLTNETLFDQTDKPEHLIILGGGPIGVEMAQAHVRLGAKVTLVDGMTILNREDADAVGVVRQRLEAEGVQIIENTLASEVSQEGTTISVTLSNGTSISGDRLLVAVGRKANFDNLGLDMAGVETHDHGIVSDDNLRTSNKRIFVAGDVAGGKQFTHVAGDHASTLVRRLLFKAPAKKRDALAPQVTYCDPELASVGLNETAAKEAGLSVSVSTWSFDENDRARAEKRTDGFLKVVTTKSGKILGASIVGKGAGDEITTWAKAIANDDKIVAFTKMIAPYPTRSEISKRAAGAFYTPTLFSGRTKFVVKLLSLLD